MTLLNPNTTLARDDRRWFCAVLWMLVALVIVTACGSGGRAKPGDKESPDAGSSAPDAQGPGTCTTTPCTPCEPNPCSDANTLCVVDGATFRCECAPGYHAVGTACEADERCLDTSCAGHGVCSESGGTVSCACEAGYTGASCSECDTSSGYLPDGGGNCSLDPCTPNPCSEPGRMRCTATASGPMCDCDAGTHDEGGSCVPDASCAPTTCAHGTCTDTATGPVCECSPGWRNAACDACDDAAGYHADGAGGCTADPCLPNPCTDPSRGVCIAQVPEYRCECDPGTHDVSGVCVADEVCDPASCNGHGTCAW